MPCTFGSVTASMTKPLPVQSLASPPTCSARSGVAATRRARQSRKRTRRIGDPGRLRTARRRRPARGKKPRARLLCAVALDDGEAELDAAFGDLAIIELGQQELAGAAADLVGGNAQRGQRRLQL